MIHHLPQACKSTQKSASSFRTLDPLGHNPLSVPHHSPPSAGFGTTKLSYPSVQQPCPRLHSASDGKRQALPSRQSCHNTFHYMAAKTNPSQGPFPGGQHLEFCNLCNQGIKAPSSPRTNPTCAVSTQHPKRKHNSRNFK